MSNFTVSKSSIDSLLKDVNQKSGIEQIETIEIVLGGAQVLTVDERAMLYKLLFDKVYSLGDEYQIGKALSNYGYFLTLTDRYQEAKDSIGKAIEIFKKYDYKVRHAFALSQLSLLEQRTSNYNKAMELNLKAYSMFDKDTISKYIREFNKYEQTKRDSIGFILSAFTIITTDFGLLFYELKDFDSAEDKFKECLNIAEAIGDLNRVAGTLSNLAMLEEKKDNLDYAVKLYLEAIETAKKVGNLNYIANINNNLGNIYSQNGQYPKSITYYQKAIDFYAVNDLKSPLLSTQINLAYVYFLAGEVPKAITVAKESFDSAKSLGSLQFMSKGAEMLSMFYSKNGNFKEAFEFLTIHKEYNDSLSKNIYNDEMFRMRTQMDFEKKEAQISILSKENSKKQTQFTFLVITIVLIAIIAIIIWNRYYSISKLATLVRKKNDELEHANQILEQSAVKLKQLNETKDKFLSIIAHDIRNPLSVIIGISSLIQDKQIIFDDEEYDNLNGEILSSAKNLNDLLQNLLLWSLTQRDLISFNPEQINLKGLIDNTKDLFKINANHKQIKIISSIPTGMTIFADLNMLSTILRNIINNAIKFSQINSEIKIEAFENEYSTTLHIIDNGVGMTQEQIDLLLRKEKSYSALGTLNESGTGLGLLLVNELLAYHDGTLEIQSKLNEGSTFILSFPQKK
ncbi:MAG: tetratricopeptide repeat-containing sensor histidine kinase [Desulfobulbaceae bacterium]|nr:tetratricopeptide repeat-containing sensor histidine kinase [Desulfobulbaceae bacterium]